MITDSGERVEFDSGAVRDIKEGKGRCDLLPLDVVNKIVAGAMHPDRSVYEEDKILESIHKFQIWGIEGWLMDAVINFIDLWYSGDVTEAMLELSVHYEEGLKKYGEWNWTKGIPVSSFISSGVRHYLKTLRGDTDESHKRAFLWNMIGAIWTKQNRPELFKILDYNEGYVEVKQNVQVP